MNFGHIIKRAWQLVWRYRFLWWLGILALFTEGSLGSAPNFNFYSGGSSLFNGNSNQTPSTIPNIDGSSLIKDVPRVLGTQTSNFFNNDWGKLAIIIFIVILLLLILCLVIFYFSYCAKAGLILSVNSLEEGKENYNFKIAFHQGRRFFWRLFGMNLLMGLLVFLSIGVLSVPVIIVLVLNQSITSIVAVILYAIFVFLLLFIFLIYLSIVLKIAERALVLNNWGITKSLNFGQKIIKGQFGNTFLTWLISVGLELGYGLALLIVLTCLGAILIILGIIIYFIAKWVGVAIYCSIFGLALLVLIFALNGYFTAFISSYWTLAYRQIQKLAK
jgi:hypothetical protein